MVDKKNDAAAGKPAGGPASDPEQIFETEACWSDGSGTLLVLNTGEWRTEHPIFDKDKCNACGFCYIFCPVQCIVDDEDGVHYQSRTRLLQGLWHMCHGMPQGRYHHGPRGRLRGGVQS